MMKHYSFFGYDYHFSLAGNILALLFFILLIGMSSITATAWLALFTPAKFLIANANIFLILTIFCGLILDALMKQIAEFDFRKWNKSVVYTAHHAAKLPGYARRLEVVQYEPFGTKIYLNKEDQARFIIEFC